MLKRDKTLRPQKKKGQSTVEYIILVAAVIAAVLVFIAGPFQGAVSQTFNTGSNGMTDMANRLQTSRPLAP
jgi:Flp pilus assembly pilin Flp